MKRVRVLVADDNKAMLQFVVSMLAVDFDVIQAVNDGAAAVAAARRLLPDVAILDISMPGLNGIETARRIREESRGTAVVFLTIHSDLDILEAALATGAMAYVLKLRLGTDVIPAIRLALAGRSFVSPSIG
jgi:DNA-binding NarL/FixJ family response regulator